jgi:hypothetical protein
MAPLSLDFTGSGRVLRAAVIVGLSLTAVSGASTIGPTIDA